jgi:hypothetical protein
MGSNILWVLPTSREQRVPARLQRKYKLDPSVLKDGPCRLFGTPAGGVVIASLHQLSSCNNVIMDVRFSAGRAYGLA